MRRFLLLISRTRPWPTTWPRSFPYVATWSREPQVFRAALGRIQSLSSLLIDRIEMGKPPDS